MNCRFYALLLGLLLLAASALAQPNGYSATYAIIDDTVVVEEHFTFPAAISSFTWQLPSNAEVVEAPGRTVMVSDSKATITGSSFTTLTLKYLTTSLLEKTNDRFFALDTSRIQAFSPDIMVNLPEGATLKYALDSVQASVIPKPSGIETDGKRISFHWDETSLEETILIIYQQPTTSLLPWIMGGVAVIVLVVVSFFRYKKEENKEERSDISPAMKEEHLSDASNLTRNLFEEERAIVEILLKAKDQELWQKQLVFETGLSKVKLSRKLRNLEAKGIIERLPYGNTNKVRIKDKQGTKESSNQAALS